MLLKQAIGIDLSKDKFDVCFSNISDDFSIKIKGSRKFSQNKAGFESFLKWTKKFQIEEFPLIFIMEATGVYHENLCWFLYQNKRELSVVVPSKAKKFIESTDYKTKNDSVDAKALAQFGLERKLRLWKPLSESTYKLRHLTRELHSLNEERTAVKNKIHAYQYSAFCEKSSLKRLESRLSFIDKQIVAVKKAIDTLIAKDKKLQKKVNCFTSIKGVGVLTAANVIAETDGFSLIESQGQLVSYAGLDVVKKDSGKKKSVGKISKRGNKYLRKSLFMPSFSLVTHNVPVFKNLHSRLIKKGSTPKQAYTAVQKKLLVTLWALWKKEEEFDPKHYETAGANGGQKDIQKLEVKPSLGLSKTEKVEQEDIATCPTQDRLSTNHQLKPSLGKSKIHNLEIII